ncbi:fluoride efflux transporter FluC [Rubellimicrobium roseum]|uniref:Fluoride-specific ion channel FluC n=1 Tax=Rubellimicrobium roseum TaxID=687525 RepID=A0A5C4NAC5_9RHOB|nr:CrcB family protein [Rubellimicrobium roseum]TNC65171.1 fluoride efflux transporter CrcB [Rubellimicrobium roseum]
MIHTLLLVALGGALGSSARALVGMALPFPWATLAVNVAGGLMMGWLFALLGAGTALGALLLTGVLGGFTTFSAFSLDTLRLVETGRMAQAGLYVLASVGLSLLACRAGLWIGRLA